MLSAPQYSHDASSLLMQLTRYISVISIPFQNSNIIYNKDPVSYRKKFTVGRYRQCLPIISLLYKDWILLGRNFNQKRHVRLPLYLWHYAFIVHTWVSLLFCSQYFWENNIDMVLNGLCKAVKLIPLCCLHVNNIYESHFDNVSNFFWIDSSLNSNLMVVCWG